MIERGKILREIRKRAKRRGRDVRVDTKAGKGSHAKVYVGQRRTVVPQRASSALVRQIMKQLDLEDYPMRKLEYPCQLSPDEEGGFSVSFPDVPEALTYGDDRDKALEMAEDALSVALTFYLEAGEPVPVPGRRRAGQVSVSPNLQIALKIALADALRESAKRPADLARLIGTDFKSVKRLLDPNHSSRIPALEKALACLGKRVAITTEDKAA